MKQKDLKTDAKLTYLYANHLLWDVHHGACQPVLKTLGKVADGLS